MNLKYMKVSLFEITYKEKNELFHDILINWDAPVVVYYKHILRIGGTEWAVVKVHNPICSKRALY